MDYYAILGIEKVASEADVKKAYRKLAVMMHPDKNRSDPDAAAKMFQDIGEAYEVLSDAQKRAIYDRYGYEGLRDGVPGSDAYCYMQNAQEIFENFFGSSNPFADFGFGDESLAPFAARLGKPKPKRAEPVTHNLPCSLEEMYNGCVKRLQVTRLRLSPEGELNDDVKELTVNIKPGWKKGTKITFPGEGDEAPGMLPADVIFVLVQHPHDHFVREGSDLVFTARVSLADALADCIIEIPTLDGRILSLPCPEVVCPKYEKRVRGEGMPLSKKPGERGDLIIRFSIVFPKYLPDAKKAALRSLLKSEIDMSPDLPKVPVTGDAAPEVENSPVEEDVN